MICSHFVCPHCGRNVEMVLPIDGSKPCWIDFDRVVQEATPWWARLLGVRIHVGMKIMRMMSNWECAAGHPGRKIVEDR